MNSWEQRVGTIKDGTFTDVTQSAGLRTHREPKDYEQLAYLGQEARERLELADRDKVTARGSASSWPTLTGTAGRTSTWPTTRPTSCST
jgi:hypothetical protein